MTNNINIITQLFISLLNNSNNSNNSNNFNKLEIIKPNTEKILLEFYNLFMKSSEIIDVLKKNKLNPFNIKINKIQNINQIPKPNSSLKNSFPTKINNYIEKNSNYYIFFNNTLCNRNINLYFILNKNEINKENNRENNKENKNIKIYQKLIKKYNNYIEIILKIIYLLNFYSTNKNCSKNISIYIYFNNLNKLIPKTNSKQKEEKEEKEEKEIEKYILNENEINSAFTNSCQNNNNIIIFRKDEWIKVLIHELFHSFGLDFSLINYNNEENMKNKLKNIFNIVSEYKLYESYSEFWARFINIFISSFFISNYYFEKSEEKNKQNNNKEKYFKFLNYFNVLVNIEIYYSIFQMIKILNYMNLKYENIIENDNINMNLKSKNYKENTEILCYYIITSILLNNYNSFIDWTKINNQNILQFSNSNTFSQINSINNLIKFIKNNYKKKKYLYKINNIENIFFELEKKNKKEKDKNINYLLNNLNMTITGFF